jgi:UDP-4-keto-D-QuiNAc 4-reductase
MKALVTGASGFVGGAVVRRLAADGLPVRAASRRPIPDLPRGVEQVIVGDLGPGTDWSEALAGVDVVVHAAARVHVMRDVAADPLGEFRRINVDGTLALARQAARSGAGRFVFLSSIKVNGESTPPGRPFTPDDASAPVDPYGVSKLEAEQGLLAIAQETRMSIVIIRPVLVYGPGVKGNFLSMMRWVQKGLPLPLGAVDNRRSLVALDNLVDLIVTVMRHPAAAGRVFLAADGEDLSTTMLLRRTAAALGRPSRLIPVPAVLLRAAARLAGRSAIADRLLGTLQVDIEEARRRLGWSPPVTVDAALRQTAGDFQARRE